MPTWLQITLALAGVIVGPWVAHAAAKRGAQQGLEIALAVHDTLIKELQKEVAMLRHAKHEHANRLTEHEADLYVLKHKANLA